MCCIFHDSSYSASEVILWWNAVRLSDLSLSLSYTHTKIETSSRELPDVLFFECDDICLHRKLDTGFFSLETVSEIHFHIVFSQYGLHVNHLHI